MSNKQVRKKKSTSYKRKRIEKVPKVTLPNQSTIYEEEDIELDHTPKSRKMEVTTMDKPSVSVVDPAKEEAVDSDDDLLNDNSFAKFCNASIVEKIEIGVDLDCFLDFDYERKMIEQAKRDFEENIRVKRINDELNRLIKEQVDSTKTVDLKCLTHKEREEHLNILMDGDMNNLDMSMFEQEETYERYYQQLRMELFCEELSRFNVFYFPDTVSKIFIHGEEAFMDEFSKFTEPKYEYFLKRKKLVLENINCTCKQVNSESILEDFGLACLQSKKKMNEPFLSVEVASLVLQSIEKGQTKLLQHVIRKTVRAFVNGKDVDVSEQDLACLVVQFLICQEFTFYNYPGKLQNSFKLSVYSTLAKTKIINTSDLTFILASLDGNYSMLITDLFTLFGFSQQEHSTLSDDLTLNSINSIIRDYFPPTFSKFIMCKPFYNTNKTVIGFYKKFFTCLLIKVTGITEISTEEILSVEYEFNNNNNRKLLEQVLSVFTHTVKQANERKEFEFPLLYLTKNIFYLLDICVDLARDSSIASTELLQLSAKLRLHFHYSDYSFLKLQFPYLDASFMENLDS